MIKALTNRHYYLRFAFSLLLLAFTGCKIITPVYILVNIAYKEITAAPDNDNIEEESADLNKTFEKAPEFIALCHQDYSHILWYTQIIHYTAYINHYQTGNYFPVSSPPPDIYLHTTV